MRVTAVVVAWNSAAQVGGCLRSLLAQDHPVDVVVVDNASQDASREVVEAVAAAHPGRVRLLANAANRGFAGGVNDGIAVTEADAVLLCNPDVRLAPDHVGLLVAALAADERLGSVQGTLWRPPGDGRGRRVIDSTGHRAYRTRLFANRDEGRTTPSPGGRVFGVTGAAALHRRAMLDDVAFPRHDGVMEWLDETLFAYYDDIDLDWRARLRGWEAAHVPAAEGEHERGGAGPRRSRFVEELNAANRLLVVAKLDDRRELARALPGVVLGTVLKLVWLLLTAPPVLPRVVRRWVRVRHAVRLRRAHAMATATVDPAVVSASFERFDWRGWVTTWWRRLRA